MKPVKHQATDYVHDIFDVSKYHFIPPVTVRSQQSAGASCPSLYPGLSEQHHRIQHRSYIQGLPSTRALIQNFASDVAKSPVSESWVTRFIGRYIIHLISKWVTGMDNNRHQADSGAKYSLYFYFPRDKITHYSIEPVTRTIWMKRGS
jgi:hypothetical protein